MSLAKSTSVIIISIATTVSRILGLVRDQLFAFLLGASDFADAFFVAFRIPNMLRDLFAEGALSTAFIPTFTDYLVKKDKKEAFHLANLVINLVFIVISLLVIAGYFFTPQVVNLVSDGYSQNLEKYNLIITLTRILMPFLLFVSLAAVFMGILNTHNKFFIPAIAPAMFNIVIVLSGFVIIILNPTDINKAILWAFATLAGGFVQFFIQVPAAKKIGYTYRPVLDLKFKHEGVSRILKLMLPAIIGLAAIQVSYIINTKLASYLPSGSVSFITYSFRLLYFPIGVFGVSIATVSTALIARHIAQKDYTELKDNISFSMKLNSFFSFPSTVVFMTLGIPIIKLIYEHGKFDHAATLSTSEALFYYAPILFFYSGIKIFAPVFYAMKKSHIPVISSFLAVAVNLAIGLSTYRTLQVKGLCLALTCGSFINFIFLFIMFTWYYGFIKKHKILITFGKHIFCSILAGITGYYTYQHFINSNWIGSCLLPLLVCGITYLLFSILLKVKELEDFLVIFIKKFNKPKAA